MVGMRERFPMLVEMRSEHRQVVRSNFDDKQKDRTGVYSASLIGDLRFFAVAQYCLENNIDSFRSQLSEAASIRREMFQRIDNGEPIDPGYNSILSYQDVLNALAAGDFDTAESLADRVSSVPVRSDIHKFDEALGRSLCSLVANSDHAQQYNDSLFEYCRLKHRDFLGYAEFFSEILRKDADAASEALSNLVAGHKRQSKGRGIFADSVDSALCVWGIGVANLGRHRGVNVVSPDEELVPSDLLI